MFAVVKNTDGMGYKFTKLHKSKSEAIEEAKRLCQIERGVFTFLVLEVIGEARQQLMPIEFEEYEKIEHPISTASE